VDVFSVMFYHVALLIHFECMTHSRKISLKYYFEVH